MGSIKSHTKKILGSSSRRRGSMLLVRFSDGVRMRCFSAHLRTSCFIVFVCLIYSFSVAAIFEHDRAALAYQKGDYAQSRDFMQKTLICNPGDPVCLYDSGVVAYRNNDLDQAQAYFSTVTQHPAVDTTLLEKAHFNRAKVYEKRDEYEQAIEQYNRVLQINPDNYKAQQEKARLEKLLEKKKKEQEKEKQQKQGSSQKDSKQQNNKDQQPSDQDAKQDKQNQPNAGSQQQQSDKHRGEKPNSGQTGNEKAQKNDAKQEPLGNEQGAEKQAEQTVDKQAEHAKSPEKEIENRALDSKGSNKKSIAEKKSAEQAKQADAPDGMPLAKKMDAMLERILAEQEKNDASLNKKCIKATVKQHMAGGNDQNCW